MRLIFIAFILCTLSSCSTLRAIGAIAGGVPGAGGGIDATAQVGKNNTSTKGLVNARSTSSNQMQNTFEADKVYQNTYNKDSPWLIIAFGLMTGFFVMHIANWLKSRNVKKRKMEALHEIRSELGRFDWSTT